MNNIGCKGNVVDCLTGAPDCTAPDPFDPLKKVCIKRTKVVTPTPNPDNNKKKKKKEEKPVETGCKDSNGNVLDTSMLGKFDTDEKLNNFKDFLNKYHSDEVANYGGSEQLKAATITSCMLAKLFFTTVSGKYGYLGTKIYNEWSTHTKNNSQGVTDPSVDDYKTWLKTDAYTITNPTNGEEYEGTWDDLIRLGQVKKEGVQFGATAKKVMLFKAKNEAGKPKIVPFDDSDKNENGQITTESIYKNINYTLEDIKNGENPEIQYFILRFPTKNVDQDKGEFPLKTKKQILFKSGDSKLTTSEEEKATVIRKLPKPSISGDLKESKSQVNLDKKISTFILERIKEKLILEDKGCDCGDGTYHESCCSEDDVTITDDVFGINNDPNLQTSVAKQSWMNKKVVLIQDLINKGAKSNFFVAWNDLAKTVTATKLNLPKSTTPITKDNSFNVGEPKSDMIPQYQKEPFYQILGLAGDPNKNKATIYQPIGVTDTQKLISSSSSPQWCRSKLLNYLKVGLTQKFMSTVGNESADYKAWKLKREICDCNSNGAFENFKTRGKDVDKDFVKRDKLKKDEFTTINKDQQTLVYDPTTDSYVNKTSTNVDKLSRDVSPFVIFNKKLNWREIVSLLNGNFYTSKGGLKNTIDNKLIISGFDKGIGSTCLNDSWRNEYAYKEEGTVQKESLDNRIEKKLSETIKSKNKKETLVENVLKKLLKDKL